MSLIIPSTDSNTKSLVYFDKNGIQEKVSGVTWSRSGWPSIVIDSNFGGYVYRGTSNSYYISASVSTGQNYTVEAWVYMKNNYNRFGIIDLDGLSIWTESYNVLCFDDTHTRLRTTVANGWHHVAACQFSTTDIRVFIDGKYIGRFGCGGHSWSNSHQIKVGYSGYGYMRDNTYIGAVRVSNTCRYSSNFDVNSVWTPQHIGLVISKSALNFTDNNEVTKINITGSEPADTKRRFAFKIGNSYVKLTTGGGVSNLATQAITADSVLSEGNTAAELTALTSIPAFVGKMVYPVAALYAPKSALVMPSFGMSVVGGVNTAKYTYTDYSQEYHLSDSEVFIVSVNAQTNVTGNGRVDVAVRLKQDGNWGDYIAIADAAMKRATDIQVRAIYSVGVVDGADSAKVENVTITYTAGTAITNGVTTEIVTTTQQFSNNLTYVYALAKHRELMDAKIKAFVSLRDKPGNVSMKHVGYGTGERNTYQLAESGINQSSLAVYVDGSLTDDYSYNTETSQLTITAEKDSVITASYEYGWGASDWMEMEFDETQVNDSGDYTSRYTYEVPASEAEKTVTAVKFQLLRPEGKVENENIGTGTGKRQIIQLEHYAKKETIVCTGSWSYDYDNRLLTVIAGEGEAINISYDYIAESPQLYSVMAGWTD